MAWDAVLKALIMNKATGGNASIGGLASAGLGGGAGVGGSTNPAPRPGETIVGNTGTSGIVEGPGIGEGQVAGAYSEPKSVTNASSMPAPSTPAPSVMPEKSVGENILRTLMAIQGFRQGPSAGMSVLDYFQKQDMLKSQALSKAAAEGLSLEDAQARYPGLIPDNVAKVATSDTSQNITDNQPRPSRGTPTISFPSSMEDLTAAKIAEEQRNRATLGWMEGLTSEQRAQHASLAELNKMPLDYGLANAATEASMPEGGFSPGVYRTSHAVGPMGMTTQAESLPPLQQAITYDTFNKVILEPGYGKNFIPNESEPGTGFLQIVDKDNDQISLVEYALQQGGNDPDKAAEIYRKFVGSIGGEKSRDPASPGGRITNLEQETGQHMTSNQREEFLALIAATKENIDPAMENMLIRASKEPGAEPYISPQKKLDQWITNFQESSPEAQQAFFNERKANYEKMIGEESAANNLPETTNERPALPAGYPYNEPSSIKEIGTKALPIIPRPLPSETAPKFGLPNYATKMPKQEGLFPTSPSRAQQYSPKTNKPTTSMESLGPRLIPALALTIAKELQTSGPEEAGKTLAAHVDGLSVSGKDRIRLIQTIIETIPASQKEKLVMENTIFSEP